MMYFCNISMIIIDISELLGILVWKDYGQVLLIVDDV
jgi:hypothetical protein